MNIAVWAGIFVAVFVGGFVAYRAAKDSMKDNKDE